MDWLTLNRQIWTSIESYSRWIEKAQAEIRSSYDLSSPSFQNNLHNLMDISDRLMASCESFKEYQSVNRVEMIAEEILVGAELISNQIKKKTDQKIVGAQLELLKRKVKELKEVYAKIVSGEQRKVA